MSRKMYLNDNYYRFFPSVRLLFEGVAMTALYSIFNWKTVSTIHSSSEGFTAILH